LASALMCARIIEQEMQGRKETSPPKKKRRVRTSAKGRVPIVTRSFPHRPCRTLCRTL
jgi:hypothetical protein